MYAIYSVQKVGQNICTFFLLSSCNALGVIAVSTFQPQQDPNTGEKYLRSFLNSKPSIEVEKSTQQINNCFLRMAKQKQQFFVREALAVGAALTDVTRVGKNIIRKSSSQ